MRVSGQIATTIVKAGQAGKIIINWTTGCINQYDMPGYTPNSQGRRRMFMVALQLAQEIVKNEPPPFGSVDHIRHQIDWTGE